MLTTEVRIAIPGHPATKGSMVCIGRVGKRAHVVIESHGTAKPWLDAVTLWCRKKLAGRYKAAARQPLGAECTFTLERPKGHYGTGRNAGILKARFEDAQPVGHDTGDVDKLLRVVLDALQKSDVIPDDCAVIEATTRKSYVQPEPVDDVLSYPGVVIRLYPL
jgi:hypothetical protein